MDNQYNPYPNKTLIDNVTSNTPYSLNNPYENINNASSNNNINKNVNQISNNPYELANNNMNNQIGLNNSDSNNIKSKKF